MCIYIYIYMSGCIYIYFKEGDSTSGCVSWTTLRFSNGWLFGGGVYPWEFFDFQVWMVLVIHVLVGNRGSTVAAEGGWHALEVGSLGVAKVTPGSGTDIIRGSGDPGFLSEPLKGRRDDLYCSSYRHPQGKGRPCSVSGEFLLRPLDGKNRWLPVFSGGGGPVMTAMIWTQAGSSQADVGTFLVALLRLRIVVFLSWRKK